MGLLSVNTLSMQTDSTRAQDFLPWRSTSQPPPLWPLRLGGETPRCLGGLRLCQVSVPRAGWRCTPEFVRRAFRLKFAIAQRD